MGIMPDKVPWNMIGAAIGIIGIGFGIYESRRDRSPQLEFDILSNTPVLTTAEDVPELKILYEDLDIRQREQLLSVVEVRVLNSGESDIHKGHYDPSVPVGVQVQSGLILDPRIVGASSDYLREQASIRLVGPVSLDFDPVILEVGEFFVVKFLVLHSIKKSDDRVAVLPRGKVAGVKHLTTKKSYAADNSPGLFSVAFAGPVASQAVRLVVYPVGLILVMAAFMIPIVAVTNYRQKRRYGKLAEAFRAKHNPPPEADGLLKMVEDAGETEVFRLARRLGLATGRVRFAGGGDPTPRAVRRHELEARRREEAMHWLDSGIMKEGPDGTQVVDEDVKKVLEALVAFLREDREDRS